MKRRVLGTALASLLFLQSALRAQVPDTPAGHQFAAWLEAFNSGDRERIRKYLEANFPAANVENQLRFRERTGGFDLRRIEQTTPTTLVGVIQEHSWKQFGRFKLTVNAAQPHAIARFEVTTIPRPPEFVSSPSPDSEIVQGLRSTLAREAAADHFAGTVLLARLENGKPRVLFSGAYGLADRDRQIANRLDTRFRLGSMNKMFTAVSILQLVQAGKVKLSEPLGTYVPDYPNRDIAAKVTIHQLLTHTGGTGDFFGPEFSAHRLELKTPDDYVKLLGARGPAFEPGSRFAYSNYGMILLGVVIERVTHESYYDYVADHIYRPAGMTRSGSEPEDKFVADRSVGYTRAGGSALRPNTYSLPYRGIPAGGGYSTVGDLLAFATALMNYKLLNAEYTTLLITGKVEGLAPGRMYAYGFEDVRARDGSGAVGHGGGAPGMNGELRIYPKSGYVVAVLSNLDPPAATQVAAYLDVRLAR